jgi:alpha-tubulin suppressor-like RCC1 family protein
MKNVQVGVLLLVVASTIYCANNVYSFGATRTDATTTATTPSVISTTLANSDYFVSVAAGAEHTLFLSSKGVVYGMGNSAGGRLGQGVDINTYITTPTPIVDTYGVLQGKTVSSIHAGNSTSSIFTTDGNVYTFGTNNNGALGNISSTVHLAPLSIYDSNFVIFSSGRTITSITQSGDTVMMICNDGIIFGFGYNGKYYF